MSDWTHLDAESLYNIPNWGGGYFHVNAAGHMVATPDSSSPEATIDLADLVGQIRRRGIATPILLRLDGILRGRVRDLNEAFNSAREEFGYSAPYRGVYPIKVNQQRHLVEALLEEGRKHGTGLEVGSKPELLAAIALQAGDDSLVICNGYKDEDYVETALLASRLGIVPILVIEKFSELPIILAASQRLEIDPVIGVRAKLGGRGSGRWSDSGGDRSKFGLTTRQIVQVIEMLEEHDMLGSLQLLHFHIGSQVTDIRAIKNALREATRTLAALFEMGAHIRYMDVGGGLGIDYDGSRTNFESSMNYSLEEYARDIVYQVAEICREHDLPQPAIITESGRALTAHHAILITEVLGVTDHASVGIPDSPTSDESEPIHSAAQVCDEVSSKNYQESYHDALQMREEALTLFNVGQLTLRERARIEEFFWRTCQKVLRIARTQPYVPEELASLERDMADIYFANFSVFQSLPDVWAIQQLFPILPIHRLHEEPVRRAVLADITCDSDGKVDTFIDLHGTKNTLELHPLRPGEPYYIGFFLVGAYQEILGDMHNLFGDPNIVHVDLDREQRPRLTHFVRGDRTQEVLSYVEYFEDDLLNRLRHHIEHALESGRMSLEQSALLQRRYEAGLASYTYLSREGAGAPSPIQQPVPRAATGQGATQGQTDL